MSGGYAGNGRPRVGRLVSLPDLSRQGSGRTSGSPYDTETPDLHQVLAELAKGQAGVDRPPTDLAPGDMDLPRRMIDRFSGFLDRLIDEHWSKRMIPANPKDPTESVFGAPTKESTITWGQTADLSFVQNPPVGPEPVFPITSPNQIVQIMRPRPATHTVLVTVALGGGWNGENQTTVVITYTLGVGQVKTTIPKTFVLSAASLVSGSNTVPIVDVNTWPLQSLQVNASISVSPANNGSHGVTVTGLIAPIVQ